MSPGPNSVDLGLAIGHDDGGAAAAFQHISPLGGQRMPVQFANGAGLEAHGDAGDALGNGELRDGGFFSGAGITLPLGLILDIEFEARERLELRFGRRRLHLAHGQGRERRRAEYTAAAQAFSFHLFRLICHAISPMSASRQMI